MLGTLRAHLGTPTLAFTDAPRRLGGGFFTENHAFRLADAPPGWDGPLVLRLFPSSAPADLAFREAAVQTALTNQQFPAAPVVWFDDAARLDHRRFFVMGLLPGRAVIGGMGARELARAARFSRRLPEITASIQSRLHDQDPAELAQALGDDGDGVDRAVATLQADIDGGAKGFGAAVRWLVEQRPVDPARGVICHGDLWGGNILVDHRGHTTGVLDWTTSTISEPALDVGATALAFCLIPMPLPGPVRAALERRGRALYGRYLRAYEHRSDAGLRARPYYEALRCATELSFVASWRLASASGEHDLPRPSWDAIPDSLIEFFRARTGVTIALPARVP